MKKSRVFWYQKLIVLFLVSIILNLVCPIQIIHAAVLDTEILTNVTTENNSQTTPEQRWQVEEQRQVDFTIEGSQRLDIDVKVLAGRKRAVLVYPSELIGKVQASTEARGEIAALLKLTDVAMLSEVLKAIEALLNIEIDLGLVRVDLTDFRQQVQLLKQIENLGTQSFTAPIEATDTHAIVDIDNTLGILLSDLTTNRLMNVLRAAKAIKVEVRVPIVGDLLATTLKTAIKLVIDLLDPLLASLTDPGKLGQLQAQLADAAVLGSADITIPTTINRPVGMTEELDSPFVATVTKEAVVNLDLLTQSSNKSFVYFAPEIFELSTDFPDNLDFGTHPVQMIEEENWSAMTGENYTTGQLIVTDTRLLEKNWQLSVKQEGDWTNRGQPLSGELQLTLDPPKSTFIDGILEIPQNNQIHLQANQSQPIASLTNAQSMGELTIEVAHFNLYIPENTKKYTGAYQTTLVWKLSDVPIGP